MKVKIIDEKHFLCRFTEEDINNFALNIEDFKNVENKKANYVLNETMKNVINKYMQPKNYYICEVKVYLDYKNNSVDVYYELIEDKRLSGIKNLMSGNLTESDQKLIQDIMNSRTKDKNEENEENEENDSYNDYDNYDDQENFSNEIEFTSMLLYSFTNIETLITACKMFNYENKPDQPMIESWLYKDNDTYYLGYNNDNRHNVFEEYGTRIKLNNKNQMEYYEEHYQKIIDDGRAIQHLALM